MPPRSSLLWCRFATLLTALALGTAALAQSTAVSAQSSTPPPQPRASLAPDELTYADLVDLADLAPLVVRVEVREAVTLKPGRAGFALINPVRPGFARVYIKGRTKALLFGAGLGEQGLGESVGYLADVALDPKGRVAKLKKREMLVFAQPVAGRPGELRLVAPDAQQPWSPALGDRTLAVLTELVAPGAAPRVVGVREAMHVRGTLLNEGESQIFLATERGDTVSVTVLRRPGAAPAWGVALGEIVDQAARPPLRDTLTWYRLACFLPGAIPPATVLSGTAADRRQAAEDYRYVREQLGPCPRTRPAEWRRR